MQLVQAAAVVVLQLFADFEQAARRGLVVAFVMAFAEQIDQLLPGLVAELSRAVEMVLVDQHLVGVRRDLLRDAFAEQVAGQKPLEQLVVLAGFDIDAQRLGADFCSHVSAPVVAALRPPSLRSCQRSGDRR
jgi:hypothetical protein